MRFFKNLLPALGAAWLCALPAMAASRASLTLTVAAPTSKTLAGSAALTASGTTKDNVAVSNVLFSVNNSAWTAADTANGWTNWTAALTLVPGTNVFQACATDISGRKSTTNKVTFLYALKTTLLVATNGHGTVTPNYNGTPLQIGQNFTMTAKAAAGFGFANWTGSGTTNGATLKFRMASNLTFTANFTDTARPTNTIVSPTANLRVSNALFTVTGKARDNVGISNVFYSLNSSDWAEVSTTNDWTNWTAGVTLMPGTNIFQAYALDGSGHFSTTNKVSFIYILSATLTVQTNGNGTVTPNYNNILLQIGQTYSMTAKAAAGFGFANWTGSGTTNGATLKFVMASNLTFTANFTDIAKPTNQIVSPAANLRVSNALFTVTGKAKDNVGVSNVFYLLNGSDRAAATTANNWTNWTADVTLTPGTNIFQAYALDGSGHFSATNKVSFIYILSATLTVQTNGNGTIAPNYNGALLQIGQTYSMTAKAAAGFGFANWTGSGTTNGATLKFRMASNLTFTANFTDTARPTNTIVSPATGLRTSNAEFTVTGKTKDNVGVSDVFYSLNGSAWTEASTADGWTNWTAAVRFLSGTNTLQAYAVDARGNISATNKASVNCLTVDWAPASLRGLLAAITPHEGGGFNICFSTNTFSQSSTDTNNDTGVGLYTYTKLGTNTARLTIGYSAPPTVTNDGASINITFTTNNAGNFANTDEEAGEDVGEISFSPAPKLAPTSLSNPKIILINHDGEESIATFNTSSHFNVTNISAHTGYAGSFTLAQYSAVGALLKLTGPGGMTGYAVFTFTATNLGPYQITIYAGPGSPPDVDDGTFLLPDQTPKAPATLPGLMAQVTQGDGSFTLNFGTNTFSQSSAGTNYNNGVGTYTYAKVGTAGGRLTIVYTAPPTLADGGGQIYLVFNAGNFGLFTNEDGGVSNRFGTFVLSGATNFTPAALAGKTITATNDDGLLDVITFNGDGTFFQTESGPEIPGDSSGTYTFTPFSPGGAMLQLTFTDGVLAGETDYIQTTFLNAAGGTFFATAFNGSPGSPFTGTGNFTIH